MSEQLLMMNELTPQLQVLVADENEADRRIIANILHEEGCRVIEVDNGLWAQQIYEQAHPDLVWLDAYLPGLNGVQVCQQINVHAEQCQVPILIAVRLDDPRQIEQAFEMGATHCLPKPFQPTTTRNRIRRVLHARRIEKAVQRAKHEWEATFDVIADLILLTDSEGRIVRCNQAVIRQFGLPYAELLGQPISRLFYGTEIQHNGVFSETDIVVRFPALVGWHQISNYRVQPALPDGRLEHVHIIHDITAERNMAAQLYASDRRFRALVENTSEGIQLVDGSGKVVYASPHIAEMLGYEPDFSGVPGLDYIHPDDAGQAATLFNQLLQNPGASISVELRVRHKDDHWIWLYVTSRNLLDIAGVEAILVNVRDITERRLADEKLQASEARYRSLFEDSPVGLWEEDFSEVKIYLDNLRSQEPIADVNAYFESHLQVVLDCVALVKVTDVNKTAMRMLGVQKKEELFNSLTSILAVDGYKGFRQQLLAIAEGRTHITLENLNRSVDGETRYVNIIWSVWPGYENTYSRVTVSVMDLTDWRRSQEALRISRERYELVVEGSNDGIWDWDLKNGDAFMSARYKRILGYGEDELQASAETFFELIHPDDRTFVNNEIEKYLAGQTTAYQPEFRMQHKDGSYRWLLSRGVVLRDGDGVAYRLAGSVTDITERKLADARLKADEARYRALFENSPVALWEEDFSEVKTYLERLRTEEHVTDFRAYIEAHPQMVLEAIALIKVLDVNDAAVSIAGAETKAELIASLGLILSPEGFQGFCEEFVSIAEGRTRFTIEVHNRTLKGELRFVSLMWSAWPGYEENLSRVTLSIIDLTERQRAEEKLQVVTQAIEQGSTAVIITDVDGNIEYINPYFTQLTGYSLAEVMGKTPRVLKSGETSPESYQQLWSTITAGHEWHGEFHNKKKNGELFWAHASISPVVNSNGVITRFLGVQEDITERKLAEETLAQRAAELGEAHNSLDAIIENLPLTLFMKDAASLKYVRFNKASEELLGHPREELLGQTSFDLFAPETAEVFEVQDRQLLAGTPFIDIPEEQLYTDRLGLRILHTRKLPILGIDGKPRFLLGVSEDITERKAAEDALRASQSQLSEALRISQLAYWEYDVATDLFTFNDAFYSLLHTNVEQEGGYFMSSTHYAQRFVHPEDGQTVGIEIQKALETRDPNYLSQIDHRILYPDGGIGFVSAHIRVEKDADGRTIKAHGTYQDITEHKQAEARLRASEERFKLVTYATNDAVWELDLKTRLRWWNAGVRSVFGYVPEQVGVDQSWWETLIHPNDRAKVLNSLEAAVTSDRQFWSKEYRYRKADGNYAYVFDRGYIILDEKGQPQRIIGAMMDITERKRTEEALLQSEETFSKAFHASPLPMAILSVNGTIYIDLNKGWEELFNLERQKAIGTVILSAGTRVAIEQIRNLLRLLQERGAVYDYEILFEDKNREEHILLLSAQTVDIRGKPSYLATCYDITEQRRLQTSISASQKLADLGTLAAGVAHEMNSPLQVITGVSQSIMRRFDANNLAPDYLKRNLEVIHRNGWRCAEIVRSLHTYARASGGTLEPTDLNALVRDTLLLIEHQLKSWANITVLTELSPELPPLTCDHNQITQILINLLTNARDAMPQGGDITIGTRCDPSAEHLILSVRDSGIGIPDSIQARIFDPFFTTKSLGKGSGLGLSIVAGIVRAHGGTIDIESAPNKGTLFTLRFPLQPINLPVADETPGRFDSPLTA